MRLTGLSPLRGIMCTGWRTLVLHYPTLPGPPGRWPCLVSHTTHMLSLLLSIQLRTSAAALHTAHWMRKLHTLRHGAISLPFAPVRQHRAVPLSERSKLPYYSQAISACQRVHQARHIIISSADMGKSHMPCALPSL